MKRYLVVVFVLCIALAGVPAFSANVGDTVTNVTVRDASDKPKAIPDLGAKVLTIMYTDADAADLQDPLADALKAKKFNEAKYRAQGIVNLKDSKMPNFAIRRVIQGKEKKYNTTILTDPSYLLRNAWALGDCNNTSTVLIIGKDKKVKYFYKIKGVKIGAAETAKAVGIVEALIK